MFTRKTFISTTLSAISFSAGSMFSSFLPEINEFSDFTLAQESKDSWVNINNTIYGARKDSRGPLGGGSGYTDLISKGDFNAEDVDSLLKALSIVKSGQVIFIPDEIEIDLTTLIYIEKLILSIPEGVTLAGNRGVNGSKGAKIFSDALDTHVIFKTLGPNVRITGLRIQGPNANRYLDHHKRSFGPEGKGRDYYYKFPVSAGISTNHSNLEIDNCEISAFSRSAIYLNHGQGHHVHHNFIHKCQYNGLGYGISHNIASSLLEHNLFDENRHSIAGTGAVGCSYIARHNVELGTSLSHCFDMHGGRDRKDGTNIAGTSIQIYNNTFRAPQFAVVIRGVPEDQCEIKQNWFVHHKQIENAVKGLSKNTVAFNNVFGKNNLVVK